MAGAVLALGLTAAPAAAGTGSSDVVNLVDLSLRQGGGSAATAAGSALAFSVHNAGPADAAGPVELDVVLVHTGAAASGLPAGCAALGGSATRAAPLVHCVLTGAVPANGAADVSIPLAGSGGSAAAAGPAMLALVHVAPALGSSDVDVDPLNNNAIFQIG